MKKEEVYISFYPRKADGELGGALREVYKTVWDKNLEKRCDKKAIQLGAKSWAIFKLLRIIDIDNEEEL